MDPSLHLGAKPKLPIVLGTGIGGLTVSRVLSQEKIHHILIGKAPDSRPRLGESHNLDGTLGYWEFFPEMAEFYYSKKWSVAYLGSHVLSCGFGFGNKPIVRLFFRLLGYKAPKELIHVDRLGFDAKLFETTTASTHCTYMDATIVSLEYDEASDSIKALQLSDGTSLPPSYVFDATNHGKMVSTAAGVVRKPLGPPQRVVYTHYHSNQSPEPGEPREPWEHATNFVVLYPEADSINAIAWCIPLGSYVSVGVSMEDADDEQSKLGDEQILAIVGAAYSRRGLHYRDRFTRQAPIQGLRHRYFLHDRAYGANWLLVGPAYCQVWWMASAGVGSGFAAASIASKLLDEPQKIGKAYQDYMVRLAPIQDTFNFFALSDPSRAAPEDMRRYSDRFVATNILRLMHSPGLRSSRMGKIAAPLLRALGPDRRISSFCTVHSAELADQAATWAKSL